MGRGIFFLVAGPAGVGKSTLLRRLVEEEAGLVKAVSVTTRKPRDGEVDGTSYHFWTADKFDAAVKAGEFLEHATVHGADSYGTLARFVEEKLEAGLDVVKDIDVQGVDQIRSLPRFAPPRSVSVFIMPPSHEELVARLKGRKSESEATLSARLKTAHVEMARAGEYDYVVVNDSVDATVAKLKTIRAKEKERARTQG